RFLWLKFEEPWLKLFPSKEFACNNSFHDSIGVAPFEDLYGRKCRIPIC
ncbi:hypothetical protein LINPERHAP2_LOCUS20105, partial [Linum perenne]